MCLHVYLASLDETDLEHDFTEIMDTEDIDEWMNEYIEAGQCFQ